MVVLRSAKQRVLGGRQPDSAASIGDDRKPCCFLRRQGDNVGRFFAELRGEY
jgi:hypothetical protein